MIYVNPSEHIQQQLFWYGYYEKKYILTWERFVREDSVVLDIGSNIGYYALVAAKKAVRGQVFAFEPSPPSFLQLQENIGLNALKNTRAEPLAAGEKTENKSFYIAEGNNSGMSGFTRPGTGREISIPTVRMDEWFELHSIMQLDLVKIDIEGAEWAVIQDCIPVLQKVQHLFLEYHGKTNETFKLVGIFNILKEANFSVYVQNAADTLSKPFQNKTTNTIYDVQLNLYCFKA